MHSLGTPELLPEISTFIDTSSKITPVQIAALLIDTTFKTANELNIRANESDNKSNTLSTVQITDRDESFNFSLGIFIFAVFLFVGDWWRHEGRLYDYP